MMTVMMLWLDIPHRVKVNPVLSVSVEPAPEEDLAPREEPAVAIQSDTNAVAILRRHVEAPTFDQQRAVQQYTEQVRGYRHQWSNDFAILRDANAKIAADPNMDQESKDEVLKINKWTWDANVQGLTKLSQDLYDADQQYMKSKGVGDVIVHELWLSVFPGGRMPWEEGQ